MRVNFVPSDELDNDSDIEVRDVNNNCLDITALDYCTICSVQRTDGGCGGATKSCDARLEIWAESSNYVAIRDQKMCGCPSDFVHGLAIPRAHVTGVEEPKRPTGIWAFAWAEGRSKISDEKQLPWSSIPH